MYLRQHRCHCTPLTDSPYIHFQWSGRPRFLRRDEVRLQHLANFQQRAIRNQGFLQKLYWLRNDLHIGVVKWSCLHCWDRADLMGSAPATEESLWIVQLAAHHGKNSLNGILRALAREDVHARIVASSIHDVQGS